MALADVQHENQNVLELIHGFQQQLHSIPQRSSIDAGSTMMEVPRDPGLSQTTDRQSPCQHSGSVRDVNLAHVSISPGGVRPRAEPQPNTGEPR
jgi:hypothetical protein